MLINKKYIFAFTLISSSFILASCNQQVAESVNQEIEGQYKDVSEQMERASHQGKATSSDTVSISKGIWLGSESVNRKNKQALPKNLETPQGITIVTDKAEKLQDIANQITSLTNIVVEFDDSADVKNQNPVELSYTGPMSGLLNRLATETELSWGYDKNKIIFFKKLTKTFTIYSLATKSSYNSNMSLGQKDSGDSLTTNIELNEWEDIKTELANIVPDGGATVSVSTGTITVTGTPPTIEKVAKFVKEKNRRLSKMVTLNVKVLLVTIQDSNTIGIDLNAVFKNTAGLKLSTEGSPTVATGALPLQTGSMAIIDGAEGSLSDFAGTTAAIQALAKQGQVSVVTTATVTTRNNKVAPINNVTTFSYVKEIVLGQLTENSTSATPKTEETNIGFNLQLLPNVFENGRLLLMFKMSLRELLGMDRLVVQEYSLSTPRIEERSFMQEAVLRSGQTLILTGFEKGTNSDTRYGIGDPGFMGLGGGRETVSERNIMVIMITPQILASPLDPEERYSENWGTPSY